MNKICSRVIVVALASQLALGGLFLSALTDIKPRRLGVGTEGREPRMAIIRIKMTGDGTSIDVGSQGKAGADPNSKGKDAPTGVGEEEKRQPVDGDKTSSLNDPKKQLSSKPNELDTQGQLGKPKDIQDAIVNPNPQADLQGENLAKGPSKSGLPVKSDSDKHELDGITDDLELDDDDLMSPKGSGQSGSNSKEPAGKGGLVDGKPAALKGPKGEDEASKLAKGEGQDKLGQPKSDQINEGGEQSEGLNRLQSDQPNLGDEEDVVKRSKGQVPATLIDPKSINPKDPTIPDNEDTISANDTLLKPVAKSKDMIQPTTDSSQPASQNGLPIDQTKLTKPGEPSGQTDGLSKLPSASDTTSNPLQDVGPDKDQREPNLNPALTMSHHPQPQVNAHTKEPNTPLIQNKTFKSPDTPSNTGKRESPLEDQSDAEAKLGNLAKKIETPVGAKDQDIENEPLDGESELRDSDLGATLAVTRPVHTTDLKELDSTVNTMPNAKGDGNNDNLANSTGPRVQPKAQGSGQNEGPHANDSNQIEPGNYGSLGYKYHPLIINSPLSHEQPYGGSSPQKQSRPNTLNTDSGVEQKPAQNDTKNPVVGPYEGKQGGDKKGLIGLPNTIAPNRGVPKMVKNPFESLGEAGKGQVQGQRPQDPKLSPYDKEAANKLRAAIQERNKKAASQAQTKFQAALARAKQAELERQPRTPSEMVGFSPNASSKLGQWNANASNGKPKRVVVILSNTPCSAAPLNKWAMHALIMLIASFMALSK